MTQELFDKIVETMRVLDEQRKTEKIAVGIAMNPRFLAELRASPKFVQHQPSNCIQSLYGVPILLDMRMETWEPFYDIRLWEARCHEQAVEDERQIETLSNLRQQWLRSNT